ncbi:hypothetical protein K8I61_01140 [bacterium]|nr:hypothetical protein [bacterium]
MSNGGHATDARKALAALFNKLGINRVICVDDEHATALTLVDILAWMETASPDDLAEAFPAFENKGISDRDVRKDSFRKWWGELDTSNKEEYSDHAKVSVQQTELVESPDINYMSTLSEVFEGMAGVVFLPWSPKEWAEKSDTVLSDKDCQTTLFLFDQDMSKNGGRTNEGSAIIGSILTGPETVRPLCGILTHTAELERQKERWEELAAEAGVDRDCFMVIPKSLLTDDLKEFVSTMKSTVLAPSFNKMKQISGEILASALETAKQKISDLTVLDFDHMVMRVAHGEGIWEGQVLFRLHAHFHRIESERQARENAELPELLNRIRKVSHIPEFGKSHSTDIVRKICHEELYDDGESVNSANLNITTGDIFENTIDSNERYMIATQACDLALRSNGERKVPNVLLLPIVSVSNSQLKEERFMKLPHFMEGKFAIDFLSPCFAPCWALDTCVLNTDGQCGLRLDATPSPNLLPGWSTLFATILQNAKNLIDQCDLSCVDDEKDREDILSKLAPAITSSGFIKASVTDGEVRIPLKRITRLHLNMAVDVIRQYSIYISRIPGDADLARDA